MLYVSFAEIFLRKSVGEFEAASYSEVEAYRYSTLAFFVGLPGYILAGSTRPFDHPHGCQEENAGGW